MFSQFILDKFIKPNPDNDDLRNSYGVLGGIVGICINFILFIIKLLAGFTTGSIAIMADSFNNLSDTASSVITILGFKLASKPADREHPFGHGRIEYLSALIVAFMVMLVGFQFVKSSFSKIIKPEAINFELIPFILLIVSISLKVWLSRFNKFLGEKINSSALKAASVDALGDVFTSSCVALSFLAAKFTSLPIDGYVGMGVALFIVYSGFSLVKDTLNPLLGAPPDPELVNSIEEMVLSYDKIRGIHDLIIHNYGPGKCMASIHAEIPSDMSLIKAHEIIDKAEREISSKLKIFLVIHIDPVFDVHGDIAEPYNKLLDIIKAFDYIDSIHDFRVMGENCDTNLIFDVVINMDHKDIPSDKEIIESISSNLKKYYPLYNCIITIDRHFL